MAIRFSNFVGDPFAISTVSFALIAWVIAIAGAGASPSATYLRFTWWGLVYQVLLIIAIFVLYLYNIIELYKFTLVGLLSVALVYTTNSTNTLIYRSDVPANLCCAAGCVLLSMINILWVVYFGGHPESPTNQFIDSFSMKGNAFSHGQLPVNKIDDNNSSMPRVPSQAFPMNESTQDTLTKPAYVSLSQLNGLEIFSNSNVANPSVRNTAYNDSNELAVSATTFRYKARALYSYEANPEDINEISFTKDEILEVDDIDGKWWQARRANGQVGICPSNYVKLLDQE